MTQPRSWSPASYPIRKPTDTKQEVGRIVNPPRAILVGGAGSQTKLIDTEKGVKGDTMVKGKGPVSDRGRGKGK